ncbi:MAG: hypothetical protein ACK42C_00115 [Aquificaceae bacterium]
MELKKKWRNFLIEYALRKREFEGKAKRPFELLPHQESSYWIPGEWIWRSEHQQYYGDTERKDIIVIGIGSSEDPFDLLVHELAHNRWTWRSPRARKSLNTWRETFNLAEDARIEYLASSEWNWKFKWGFPQVKNWMQPPSQEDLLAWGIYILKISNSSGKEIPEEWKEALQPVWETLQQAYGELIQIRALEEMENWLRKHFPSSPSQPLPQGDLNGYSNDIGRILEEAGKFSKELNGGKEERQGNWFDQSAVVNPSPALLSLLARLAGEDVEKRASLWGRYDPRRDVRGKEDCFKKREVISRPEVLFVIDTSGSMFSVSSEVRQLLWGIKALSKKGILRGAVAFVSGGEAKEIPLPTTLPIEKVRFEGGTCGFRQLLKVAPRYDLIIFLSDLMLDKEEREVIREMGGKAHFLYGGRAIEDVKAEAQRLGLPPTSCFFGRSVVEALQKLLASLGRL